MSISLWLLSRRYIFFKLLVIFFQFFRQLFYLRSFTWYDRFVRRWFWIRRLVSVAEYLQVIMLLIFPWWKLLWWLFYCFLAAGHIFHQFRSLLHFNDLVLFFSSHSFILFLHQLINFLLKFSQFDNFVCVSQVITREYGTFLSIHFIYFI